jgi:hypothetical protein
MALSYGYQLWRHTPVTRAEAFVAGVPMSSITRYGWGSLHTKTYLNGDDEATWSIINFPNKTFAKHPALVYGSSVDIKLGSTPIWAGALVEPDWDAGTLTAVGAPHEAEAALCFTSGGLTTTKPNTAVDQAIARGALGWSRRDNFGTTAVGNADDATNGLTYVADLLNAWADENSSGWAVTPRRQLVINGAPVEGTPKWFITPGSGVLGAADDNRVDRLFVRYTSTASGNPLATASWPTATPQGGKERGVDITSRGPLSATRAQNIAKGIWGKLGGRSGWTNGLTVDRSQVSTPGGLPARLEFIRAGHTMRLLGVPDPRGLGHHLDVVIGDTDLDHDAGTIQLNPVGLAKRSLEDVLIQDYPKWSYVAL